MNKKVLQTLEYYKIIDMLLEEADTPLAKESIRHLLPSSRREEIISWQTETSHALMRLLKQGRLPFHGLTDIRPSLVPLEKGGVLGMGELLDIARCLEIAKDAITYDAKFEDLKDALSGRFGALMDLPDLRLEINRCILSPEEMADDASSELKRIRRAMKTTNDKVREQLTATMNLSGSMLRDNIVTMRNGRYCLPVKQEYKSTFPGMIHDQSSTGSTFFIEPMAIVQLNNELAELGMKEQEEIEKILASLSALAAPYAEDLQRNVLLLAELDFIFAKAKLSKKMQGSEPLFDQDYIHIKKGRHPLIPKDKVVPIDVTLGKTYDLLIITGPNTGGKTVSLKTVGLFTLMGQAGLHIPAYDHSHLRVYEEVYADIGDEQSIEQSLSTFSSHMVNTVYILKRANKKTLALFDELGAGTDPTEGAALAIAILDNLHNRNVTAMATTHYSELKIYALSTDGVENASCEFDVESLQPTYRLLVGVPGKSNAFAISGKLGLPKDKKVIMYAPTWRVRDKFELMLDLEKMKEKFSDEYVLILRLHHFSAKGWKGVPADGFVYDLTDYESIEDLYIITDILITDYSSVMFDYAVLDRPMLFFTYDLDEYRDKLRGFNIDIEKEAPGPLLYTSDDVLDAIEHLDETIENSKQRVDAFHETYIPYECENSSEKVFNMMQGK